MTSERPFLFDFGAAQKARQRAARMATDRFLERAALEGVTDRLSAVTRRFAKGLWIGEAVPAIIRPLAEEWVSSDFDAREILNIGEAQFDLAVSLYSLQAVNDLPGALIQIKHALKPDGLFLARCSAAPP